MKSVLPHFSVQLSLRAEYNSDALLQFYDDLRSDVPGPFLLAVEDVKWTPRFNHLLKRRLVDSMRQHISYSPRETICPATYHGWPNFLH